MNNYPQLTALNIPISYTPAPSNLAYIDRKVLKKALTKLKITRQFKKYFGIQTALKDGLYAWDVEAVLERIYNNKLIGSQLDWD